MQTTVEETAKHTVRVRVEVPPDEFARDLDLAYRRLAGEVKVPGFRKGHVPKQIIDARVGRDAVLDEFVHDALPKYYAQALRDNELAPIGDPEIDLEELEEGKPLTFIVTVDVRPRLTLSPDQYKGLHVEVPDAQPTDPEIDEYVDRLRERFAELDVVSRPARPGDYVLADVRATVHGEEIPEATRVGYLGEVGSEELVPELDKELEGKRKGDILKFNAALPEKFGPELAGKEVTFITLVKEVKAKKLPAADDEFATTVSEFDSIQQLRDDIRTKLGALKEAESRAMTRDLILRKLVDSVEVELPEKLVDEETEHRVESARARVERQGGNLDEALAQQGWDELRFRSDARGHATRALKADLVLEAVARGEDLKVTKEDLDREVKALAQAMGREAKEVRKMVERSGQVTSLAGDIIRSKALDFIVDAADVGSESSYVTAPEPSHDQGDSDE